MTAAYALRRPEMPFCKARQVDFKLYSHEKYVEKLGSIHSNPEC
jgi:hypothetical protein